MTGLIVPAATLAGAATLTYLMCVRPMRASRCGTGCELVAANADASEAALAVEIETARRQMAALRADADNRSPANER